MSFEFLVNDRSSAYLSEEMWNQQPIKVFMPIWIDSIEIVI